MNHFLEILRIIAAYQKVAMQDRNYGELEMLNRLINIMGEKEFNETFENAFINDREFDANYHDFHKSMRQTDFFGSDYGKRTPYKNPDGKRTYTFKDFEGHLDMLFWGFIYASEQPYKMFKRHIENYEIAKPYLENIGKVVVKVSDGKPNRKPFKSGFLKNTVKGVAMHDILDDEPAYTFNEDDSIVECRRCQVVVDEPITNKE